MASHKINKHGEIVLKLDRAEADHAVKVLRAYVTCAQVLYDASLAKAGEDKGPLPKIQWFHGPVSQELSSALLSLDLHESLA